MTYLVSDEAGARAEIAAYILCQAGFDVVILNTAVGQVQPLSQVS